MSDFNGEDYDFAAGSIKGMRTWKVDDQGRLRGVTHPMVWLPGENVSTCRKGGGGTYAKCPKVSSQRGYYYTFSYGPTCNDPVCTSRGHYVAPKEDERHHFDPDCDCGFWAYDEHHYTDHGDILGVIEGYGRTTIGTKGFRCEKARIVALCREHGDHDVSLSLWLRLKALYPDAQFFEDYDEMVTSHGAVMKVWDTPADEEFWKDDQPEKVLHSNTVGLMRAYARAMQSNPSYWARGGVLA